MLYKNSYLLLNLTSKISYTLFKIKIAYLIKISNKNDIRYTEKDIRFANKEVFICMNKTISDILIHI